jgi:hypothetical protein
MVKFKTETANKSEIQRMEYVGKKQKSPKIFLPRQHEKGEENCKKLYDRGYAGICPCQRWKMSLDRIH